MPYIMLEGKTCKEWIPLYYANGSLKIDAKASFTPDTLIDDGYFVGYSSTSTKTVTSSWLPTQNCKKFNFTYRRVVSGTSGTVSVVGKKKGSDTEYTIYSANAVATDGTSTSAPTYPSDYPYIKYITNIDVAGYEYIKVSETTSGTWAGLGYMSFTK